ncbi:23S rRNA pseudouridine(2604) synthase RluF [Saprospiraceae bacterium]|jgi:23S rRNA pseudouridine2604 synthase|nr:23S rRNA pseudouridine(2604) synthase RluF [Bacteroidota bacterium]MDB4728460.1 23S rRNA pseudouridine(2604) synthase RluF [Saprospiraceae bacterium]MDF1866750.1 23S rRNA pseudouridine(2604) synthase RluF [Saprospiraceae bacterium]
MTKNSTSINKFISSTGICSRREADKWIEAGRVKINGEIAQKGNRVFEKDKVLLDGKPLMNKPKLVYLALHKPPGITCTTDLKDKTNIIDFVNHPKRIFPIGRLDKPSSGLIFLTNDGDIVNQILRVENNHEKEYIVQVDRPITPRFIQRMSNGIPILGTKTKKCFVQKKGRFVFKIILTQGLNRQIRRMCEYLDFRVVTLKRVRIMNVQLGNLKVGMWRDLTEKEMDELKKSLK